MRTLIFLLLISVFLPLSLPAQKKAQKKRRDHVFTLTTRFGEVRFILFDETPIHKANFLEKTKEGFYDSLTFHRVIDNFMIQGGNPYTRPGASMDNIRPEVPNDTNSLPAEIMPELSHVKGAVAAARLGDRINPQKRSSLSQFYIVQNENGTPHLDGGYTVFGKVIDGIDVVDEIAGQPTSRPGDRPLQDIRMVISVKKMSKRKIAKRYGYTYR
jgi:cyclophilin family peptidyl-prolyl cis-trans isomerase